MRAVLALVAFILVFLTVNLHLLLTTEWWKLRRRRIAAAYREAGHQENNMTSSSSSGPETSRTRPGAVAAPADGMAD